VNGYVAGLELLQIDSRLGHSVRDHEQTASRGGTIDVVHPDHLLNMIERRDDGVVGADLGDDGGGVGDAGFVARRSKRPSRTPPPRPSPAGGTHLCARWKDRQPFLHFSVRWIQKNAQRIRGALVHRYHLTFAGRTGPA
jgi:hypothetical protein